MAISNIVSNPGLLKPPATSQPINFAAYKPATVQPSGYSSMGSPIAGLSPKISPSLAQPTTPLKNYTISTDGQGGTTTSYDFHPPKPITGDTKTPSGATVNAGTGALVTPPPTFSGTVGGLIDASKQGSPAAQGYTAQTAGYGAGNIGIGQNAADIVKRYSDLMAPIVKGIQGQQTGDLTTGTAPVGEGNAAVAAAAGGAELQGLASAEQQALAGTGQQLTAQQQAATAANEAAGQAQTGQQLEQGGLGTVAGLVAPSGTYPFVFNPLTGQFSSGATGGQSIGLTMNPSTDIPSAVQAIQSNPALYNSYATAISSGYGSNGSVIRAQLDAALMQAGMNPTILAAQSTGVGQNVGTATTAPTNTWSGIYSTAQTNVANYTTAQNSINTLGNSTIDALSSLPTAAQNDPRFLGATINTVATQFNSPEYAKFNAQIAGLQRMISTYLSMGEIPTAATQGAHSIVDGSITVGALQGVLQGIDEDLGAATKAAQTTADYAKSQLGSTQAPTGSTSGSSNSNSGGTVSAGGYNFTKNAQGQWVAS